MWASNTGAVLDWNENACSTLRRNQAAAVTMVKNWSIIEGDVRQHRFSQYRGKVTSYSEVRPASLSPLAVSILARMTNAICSQSQFGQ